MSKCTRALLSMRDWNWKRELMGSMLPICLYTEEHRGMLEVKKFLIDDVEVNP